MPKWIAKSKADYHRAVKAMNLYIGEAIQQIKIDTVQEFFDFCMNALNYSKELAPIEFGDLRGTAFLEINGALVGAAMSADAGGATSYHARIVFPAIYALIQHEHPEFSHPRGGQAFYLEVGVARAVSEFAAAMSAFR